jgi:L-lysine 2,3-aminomutase
MDFDHTGVKTGEVSSFVFTYSTDRLLAEVKLCDVVCANCHRKRTYRRLSQAKTGLRPQGEALGLVQPGM